MMEHVIHLADVASLSPAHQGALNMAALGIPVFPLWGIKDGKCACGAPEGKCKAGKHPRRLGTFKEATTDAAVVNMWFKEAHLNYGVRTGVDINNSGKMLVVIDVDHYKEAGMEPLDALKKRFGALPDTAEVLTGAGGRHLYFMTAIGGDFTDALGENIDFKVNGYVVGPGSLHASGKRYEWEGSSDLFEGHEIADLPQWVIEHFSKRTRLKPLESAVTTEPMSRYEVQRLRYALLAIEPDNYRVWVRIIMALKSTGDDAQAYAIADEWSQRSDKYRADDMRMKWQQVRAKGGVTVGTIYKMACQSYDVHAATVDLSRLMASLDDSWDAPQSLVGVFEPMNYPLDALPLIVRDAVVEVQQFVQAPMAMVACSALATASLATQALHDVERARGLTGPVGLYLLTVADSGERKSTLDGHFSKPIHDYQKQCVELAAPRLVEYHADAAHWSAVKKGLEQRATSNAHSANGKDTASEEVRQKLRDHEAEKPAQPVVPRLIYRDATPEALLHGIAKEWPSVAVMSSEGGVVFGGHGMSKESQMRNLATINELWDGKAVRTDRRAADSSYTADGRMTIAIQVQAPTLKEFFESSGKLARGSGFLARFLVACPESTQGTRRFSESPEHWPMLERFRDRITELLNLPQHVEGGRVNPAMLYLSAEAKQVWITFHDEIEDRLGPDCDLSDVRDVASKIADNAARLAAIFHVIEGKHGGISAANMLSGCRIAQWHLNESRRLLADAPTAGGGNAEKMDRWLRKKCAEFGVTEMSFNEIQKLGPSPLRKKEPLELALNALSELGRLKVVAGQPRKVKLNPALLGSLVQA